MLQIHNEENELLYYNITVQLQVKNLQFEDGKMIPASKYFSSDEAARLDLTDDEKKMAEEIRVCVCLRNALQYIFQQLCHLSVVLYLSRRSGKVF